MGLALELNHVTEVDPMQSKVRQHETTVMRIVHCWLMDEHPETA